MGGEHRRQGLRPGAEGRSHKHETRQSELITQVRVQEQLESTNIRGKASNKRGSQREELSCSKAD